MGTHQVADVNNAGHFATRWRRLPGRAHRVIDGDGNTHFLLADGATNEGVVGGHWVEGGKPVSSLSLLRLYVYYLQHKCLCYYEFI